MSILNFLTKKKEKKILILDFGRGSVKGVIFIPFRKKRVITNFREEEIERFGVFDGRDFELDFLVFH